MKRQKTLRLLHAYESPNITFVDPDGRWPIVWERARGVHVWDTEGRRYLDLTAAFGVAAAGHANPRVVRAGQRQMETLLHAMGDVHPHARKAELARELSRCTFERWSELWPSPPPPFPDPEAIPFTTTGKVIFCNSGFEAVEAATKTALLATGKPKIVAFEGAYHGLGYGAVTATHRRVFRSPFRRQLRQFATFVSYPALEEQLPATEEAVRDLLARGRHGAVLVEPVQGRGGIRVPPREFLRTLRRLCDEFGALLIADEVYTGFGRTGRWFACEWSEVQPDLICLGKGLTGGFPLSGCVGRAGLMDSAWPPSDGEAIHTSTFLGHPVGCAMALAQLQEIHRRNLPDRAFELGRTFTDELKRLELPDGVHGEVRGAGLMVGLDLRTPQGRPATRLALEAVKRMLTSGFIVLPEGEHANVIGFTPPLTISAAELRRTARELGRTLRAAAAEETDTERGRRGIRTS